MFTVAILWPRMGRLALGVALNMGDEMICEVMSSKSPPVVLHVFSIPKKTASVWKQLLYMNIYIYINYDCHRNCNRQTQNCLPKSCNVSPFFFPSTRRPPSEQQHQQMMLGVPHSCKWLPESKHLAKAIALRHPSQALLSQMPCWLRQWPLWCHGSKWLYNCGNHTPKNLLML